MRTLKLRVATVATSAVLGLPLVAAAHTGGALDAEGCHADHRTGTYHCHRGEAAGYTFPNRAAMQEAVRTGTFPEKSVDEEGFFEKLWPFGKKHEQQAEPAEGGPVKAEPAKAEPAKDTATGSAEAQAVAPGSAPAAGASGAAAPADAAAPAAAAAPVGVTAPPAAAAPQTEQEKRLKVLQGLYEMGLITKEEYEAKRKEVLDTL